MSIARIFGLTALPVSLLASAGGAQVIQGAVVRHEDSTAVTGVIVQLLDASGAVVARTLTDEQGDYRLNVSGDGTFRLRALRIGFQPQTYDAILVRPGQEITRQLVLTGVPVRLDTVRVAERSACRSASDSGDVIATMLTQIRGALTAAQLAARTQGAKIAIVSYERLLDRNTDRVRDQKSSLSSELMVRPWNSRSAQDLSREGYVVTDRNNMVTYFAPDLAVLLSPQWLGDHCFQLARSSDATRLGIAFEPTRDRSRIPDIKGVLWVDRTTSELRSMEFRYANVSSQHDDAGAGGEMQFIRLKNGAWAISRWHIRMPVLEQHVVAGHGSEIRIAEIRAVGGELAFMARGKDTLFARAPLVLTGTIVDSASGDAVPNAAVAVTGTLLTGTTDGRGRFNISNLLPGEYTLEVRTPALDSLRAFVQLPLTFTDEKTPSLYRMPSARQVVKAQAAVFSGVVADSAAKPLGAVDVLIPALSLRATTNDRGEFRLEEVGPGTHEVVARRIGYGPLTASVTFTPRSSVERRIILSQMVSLDPISVTEMGAPATFWEHRRLGLGTSLTRADLEKFSTQHIAGVLSQVRGLGVITGRGSEAWVLSTRSPSSMRIQQGWNNAIRDLTENPDTNPLDYMKARGFVPPQVHCPDGGGVGQGMRCGCYARVFIDMSLMNPENPARPFDVNTISADRIEAIEYYASPSEVPMYYASRAETPCGILVIHTRRDPKKKP